MDKASQSGSVPIVSAPLIVALTGFMGSGKTTVGQSLAGILGWEFVDLDAMVEKCEGEAIRDIFAQRGEVEFRRIEHATLRQFAAECARPTVIALGGGTFVQPQNEELLNEAGARTVFLEVSLVEMLRRCQADDCAEEENLRPLARDAERFKALYEQRAPVYQRAKLTVDASGTSPGDIARKIATALALV